MRNHIDKFIDKIAKNSFVYFVIVACCIALIVGLSLSIKIDNMLTKNGTINGNIIIIDGNIEISNNRIFVYSDKNKKVYAVHVEDMYQKNCYTYLVGNEEDIKSLDNLSDLKVDIPINKTSVFERIFVKGGKNK